MLTLNKLHKNPVYETITLDYDKTTMQSSITILLNLPTHERPILTTIKLPFTPTEPRLKYKKPDYTFRDNISVFLNTDTHERIQQSGLFRCMPINTRYAYQCEYDHWIWEAGITEQNGYIVWAAIAEYVSTLEV